MTSLLILSIVATATIVCVSGDIDCLLVDCRDFQPKECLKKGLAFVRRDGRRFCCDSCAPIEDVIEPIFCYPEICMNQGSSCRNAKRCKVTEALVPKGGCYCCDTCIKRKDL